MRKSSLLRYCRVGLVGIVIVLLSVDTAMACRWLLGGRVRPAYGPPVCQGVPVDVVWSEPWQKGSPVQKPYEPLVEPPLTPAPPDPPPLLPVEPEPEEPKPPVEPEEEPKPPVKVKPIDPPVEAPEIPEEPEPEPKKPVEPPAVEPEIDLPPDPPKPEVEPEVPEPKPTEEPEVDPLDDLFDDLAPMPEAPPKEKVPAKEPKMENDLFDDLFGPAEAEEPEMDEPAAEPLDDDLFGPPPEPAPEPAPAPVDDPFGAYQPRVLPLRTWVDNTGHYQVRARLIAIASDQVRLLKDTGTTTTVPMHRLSEQDRVYVGQMIAEVGYGELDQLLVTR